MKAEMLTAARLREVLDYNRETGIFIWRVSGRGRGKVAGAVAGGVRNGYYYICIDGEDYRAHRLAWLYVKGVWPTNNVDHRDLNPLHNWFDNLRDATQAQNLHNIPRHKDNRCGFKGVTFDKTHNRFRAEIMAHGVRKRLGRFRTAIEAHSAYATASRELHGEFGRTA